MVHTNHLWDEESCMIANYTLLLGFRPLNNIAQMKRQKTKHILLIDDNLSDLRSINQLLVNFGYSVTYTINPHEALNFFREEPDKFHIIITDQFMPGLKGHELVLLIRKIREDIPVILFSGYEEVLVELQGEGIDIQRFLPKPFSKSELAEAIKDLLT
jgi:CheY-like chemotaxis protein